MIMTDRGMVPELGIQGRFFLIPERMIDTNVEVGPNSREKLGEQVSQFVETPAAMLIEGLTYEGVGIDLMDFRPNEHLPNEQNPYVLIGHTRDRNDQLDLLVNDKKIGMMNRKTSLDAIFSQIMNADELDKLLAEAERVNKKILLIVGHGGDEKLGVGEIYGADIEANVLLENLSELVDPYTGKAASEKYAVVVLNTCNPAGHGIEQRVVDDLGIPVVYPMGLSGIAERGVNKNSIVIVEPRNK